MIRKLKVRNHERGLLFREGDLIAVLQPGNHWRFDPLLKLRFDVVSTRKVWLEHKDIDLIVRSGLIGDDAIVLNLKDTERALVWIDGRFNAIAKPGMFVLWRSDHDRACGNCEYAYCAVRARRSDVDSLGHRFTEAARDGDGASRYFVRSLS
ncbi:MAG TPA: hypothetical protein VGQ46_22510 [Thermoanaerobaculia bacterium]|jgi:hypothetical protein|nr:hypothetical protein [Thermoanaerobaculia bacterium]